MSIVDSIVNQSSPTLAPSPNSNTFNLPADLFQMLQKKNGFYSGDRSLHVFPTETHGVHIGIREWNRLWSQAYGPLAEGALCFAEDVFGDQFAYTEEGIVLIDSENGERDVIAEDLEGWLNALVDDYSYLTGAPLADAYEDQTGKSIPDGFRFIAKTPFCLGGEYKLENMDLVNAVEVLEERGALAQELHKVPEGATIQFQIGD